MARTSRAKKRLAPQLHHMNAKVPRIGDSQRQDAHIQRLLSNANKCGLRLRTDVGGDGNCYFRALADQLQRVGVKSATNHQELRAEICDQMENDTSEDMAHVVTNEYIRNMRKDGTWAGEPEIIASHQKYSVNIQIITSAEVSTLSGFYMHNYKEDGAKETLYLGHIHESHYVSLEPDPHNLEPINCHVTTEEGASSTCSSSATGPTECGSPRKKKQSMLTSFFKKSSGTASPQFSCATVTCNDQPECHVTPADASQTLPIPLAGSPRTQSDGPSTPLGLTPDAPPISKVASSTKPPEFHDSPFDASQSLFADSPWPPGSLSAQSDEPSTPLGSTPDFAASTSDESSYATPTFHSSPAASTPSSQAFADTLSNLPSKPYQPSDVTCLPVQQYQNKSLKFQCTWYRQFPWLHVDRNVNGILCFRCLKAYSQGLLVMAKYKEDTFISKGFRNWKKALEKFRKHEVCDAHKTASSNLITRSTTDVSALLNRKFGEGQERAQRSLIKIVSALHYLGQQGLAIRGKDEPDGNFKGLLNLLANDDVEFESWLARKTSYTSGTCQNEILKLMAHRVLQDICKEVNATGIYGVIIDGTQDCTGKEQESICIRYVTDELDVKEEFVGLYEMPSTTGISLCRMLQDVLTRLQLPIAKLRAQTYDGASNMSGKYHGCQSEVKRIQPLASYTHCGAHVSHLITAKAVSSAPFVRDALDHAQELGKLYKKSGKFKHVYLHVNAEDAEGAEDAFSRQLKPICPTRWLTRCDSVRALLNNYKNVLEALETSSKNFGTDLSSRATCLKKCLSAGKCVLGLVVALPVMVCMENFNRILQSSSATISGMLASAELVKNELQEFRSEESFKALYEQAMKKIEQWKLDPLMSRKERIPARYAEGSQQYVSESLEEKYRVEFFKLIDSALSNFRIYFTSTDIEEQKRLTSILLCGSIDDDLIDKFELGDGLRCELVFLRHQFKYSSVEEYRKAFQGMIPEVRGMFPNVEQLLRLLLVSPASSCQAERSFSALRRVKTWLRNTMKQERLNHVMLCHVHRERLAHVKARDIAAAFVQNSESRERIFGIIK